jgi:hypothetical protein
MFTAVPVPETSVKNPLDAVVVESSQVLYHAVCILFNASRSSIKMFVTDAIVALLYLMKPSPRSSVVVLVLNV